MRLCLVLLLLRRLQNERRLLELLLLLCSVASCVIIIYDPWEQLVCDLLLSYSSELIPYPPGVVMSVCWLDCSSVVVLYTCNSPNCFSFVGEGRLVGSAIRVVECLLRLLQKLRISAPQIIIDTQLCLLPI